MVGRGWILGLFLLIFSSPSMVMAQIGRTEGPAFNSTKSDFGISVGFSAPVWDQRSNVFDQSRMGKMIETKFKLEWMPPWVQPYGAFSIGPQVSVFLGGPAQRGSGDMLGFGGQTEYQFRYLSNQLFVPSLGYQVAAVRHWHGSGPLEWFGTHGPEASLSLLLNFFDSRGASIGSLNNGLDRTYLRVSYLSQWVMGQSVDFGSGTLFVSLRLEF